MSRRQFMKIRPGAVGYCCSWAFLTLLVYRPWRR